MKNKLSIAFVYPKRFSFYPPDYFGRGLGGTESTLVLLTKALAKRGHNIEVYNCCFKEGVYDDVTWKSLWSLDQTKSFDAVISLRLLETFQEYKFNSKIKAVWIQDDALFGAGVMDEADKVNMWIVTSKIQKKFIENRENIKSESWFETRNAFDEDIYNDELRKIKKITNQAIYCSAPDRGLDYLLDIWPEIKKRIPNAKLVVTGSFALWGVSDEENNRIFSGIYNKASNLKDVKIFKRISKHALAQLQAQSEVMLYPTDFNEMFCISALECMSVGTPIISSARAALSERVRNGEDGFLMHSQYQSDEYKEEFIEKVSLLLNNRNLLREFSVNAIKNNIETNFEKLAQDWESEFIKRLR